MSYEREREPDDSRPTRRMRGYAGVIPACPVCGNLARFAADIFVGDIHIQRGVWCSEECAGPAQLDARVKVDKIVGESDFSKIVYAAPCWCALAETVVVDFCPRHGEPSVVP